MSTARRLPRHLRSAPLVLGALFLPFASRAQYGSSNFGQNQVVLKPFDWKVKSTDHFDIYYYDASEPWVEKTAQVLEDAYRETTADLKVEFDERRSFFLYASVNDMEQSNIASTGDGVGGVTEPLKDRFMAWSDGSENWLEDVVRHEYTHVCQFRVLIDGPWRTVRIIKSIVYPLWFMEGMAEFHTGTEDKTEEDMYVRDAAASRSLLRLQDMAGGAQLKPHQTTLLYKQGAAAMRFLSDQYGRDVPEQMLHAFTGRFDVSTVLQDVIGTDLGDVDRKYVEYLEDLYADQVRTEKLLEPIGRSLTGPGDSIPQFNSSPALTRDGRTLAYISTLDGFPPVLRAQDMGTGERRTVIGRPYLSIENIQQGRFTELTRILTVSPDGRIGAFAIQKNHEELLALADLRTGVMREVRFPDMMTVLEPAFTPDGRSVAFSGMRGGRTDIFLYDLESGRLENLTNTREDDQSPAFSPDGKSMTYSVEMPTPPDQEGHPRALYEMRLADRSTRRLTFLPGRARDPAYSPDGSRILFTGDPDYVNDLYELDLKTGRIARRTRSIGGSFNGSYLPDGSGIIYSSFRAGSVHVYKASFSELLDEEAVPAAVAASTSAPAEAAVPPAVQLSSSEPYRFQFSTDLFLPAFFYSSQGGFFWTSYWQGSDYLGNHQANNYLILATGDKLFNYSLSYTFSKYRPQWFFGATGVATNSAQDDVLGLTYRDVIHRQFVGAGYPFDRYHRLELTAANQSETKDYSPVPLQEDLESRTLSAAFVRDTVEGRYLVATRGSRLRISTTHALDVAGGNQLFDTHSLEGNQFIPTGGQTALALRTLWQFSFGRNPQDFALGGVGGVRGFQQSLAAQAGTRVALGNVEWRFPVVQDLDWTFGLLFPSFYFKAIYGSLFWDFGYAWTTQDQLAAASWKDVSQALGVGAQFHVFVLQRYSFVLAMDYAQQTTGPNRVFYVYLGPLF